MANWLDNAIFYEVYPQSFQDSNGDGIGDIPGIISRLGYIRELGCDALWINPCFVSPFRDGGYDVADYCTVAPRYGTNEDLKRLFEAAHALGMHVLLDLVPGHTSVEHPWFKESMRPEKNEFSSRYIWTDDIWKPVKGMNSISAVSQRNGSCVVNFFSCQPALNYGFMNPTESWQDAADSPAAAATLEAMKDVMRFWLSLGCDGFRVDMAGSLVKNDADGRGTVALWKKVRSFLDAEFPDAALVSEWGEPEKSLEGGFHMDFLLHFGPSHYNDLFRCEHPFFAAEGKGDASAFVAKYKESREKAKDGLICIPSGNHDMMRLSRHLTAQGIKAAFAFLLSMPGAPFIYYGDEIGMRYVEGLTSVEGGYDRTGSRSPMQWDATANAGFSAAARQKLYIRQDESSGRPTVAAQAADSSSIYSEVKRLIAFRRAHSALANRSGLQFVYAEKDAYPLAYLRESADERILVVINPAARPAEFESSLVPMSAASLLYSIGGGGEAAGGKVAMAPESVAFFALQKGL